MIGINSYSRILPPQMLPLSKKDDKWKEDCMDALETIGRMQYIENSKLVENYQMIRGKFIFEHYIDREDYGDLITQLSREFSIPSHLRHYDIISQVINTLSGEHQKRPDLFKCIDRSEEASNTFIREKTGLLTEYVLQQVNGVILQKLSAEGLNPDRQDFNSEEEAEQYRAAIDARSKALTPPEIERYMKTDWQGAAEIWANNQLLYDKDFFNIPEKDKVEFEDMLAADRCFRHYYLTSDYYNQETWNPINTFYHKSPEITHIEDGDYVGRVFYLSVSEIINRYGYLMKEEEIYKLEEFRRQSYNSSKSFGELSYAGIPGGTIIPYEGYENLHTAYGLLGGDPNNPETIDYNINLALGTQISSTSNTGINPSMMFQVTEGYWISQRKLGKLILPDENGNPIVMIIDENIQLPKFIKELDNTFQEASEQQKINTVTWTWVNQVYKGLKINNRFVNMEKPIYLDIRPNDIQFKGDVNIYGAKLPVCGQVFNNRNGESMSLVDLMKPHQIGYNVAMNQAYEIMGREIGRFMLMDMSFLPNSADWGGERNYEKLMLIAKNLGVAPLDGSPQNTKGSTFSHFPVIDLDESARIISRLNVATFFENQALKQVGITPQRLGDIGVSETATGVENAVSQSYSQTESYFTNFSNYKKRCLQMSIDIAQFVQSKKETIVFNYNKSDLSRAFIKLSGTDLTFAQIGVFISNSGESQRQLDLYKKLFLENNTIGATPTDLATVITSNSPSEIKAQIKASYEKTQQIQQQQQQEQIQIQREQIEVTKQIEQERVAKEDERLDKKLANDRYIAEVKALGTSTINNGVDNNGNGIPDPLEIQKFNAEQGKTSEDILFKRQQETNKQIDNKRKLDLQSERSELMNEQLRQEQKQHEDNMKLKEKELELKQKQLNKSNGKSTK